MLAISTPMPDERVIPPADISDYYERMSSSLGEKLFFLKMLPKDVTVIADFGCGDGALLRECQKAGYTTLGYDRCEDAIALASASDPSSLWTPRLKTFEARIDRHRREGKKVCLVLSSVVHEVLSEPGVTWSNFWPTVYGLGCEYVAIRDMAVRDLMTHTVPPYRAFIRDHWATHADFLQYLLKYRYRNDIEKEHKENYFPLTVEQWRSKLGISGYEVENFEHYSSAWWRAQWAQDFGIHVEEPTHLKIFLKRQTRT